MRRQSKKSLYESIMRDVAKVVKRRLNESDEEINVPKKITKLSEISFDYLLNPELNEDFVRWFPEIFKLNDKGMIGIRVYDYADSRHLINKKLDNSYGKNIKIKPYGIIYDENVAFLLAKICYLNNLYNNNHHRLFIIMGCHRMIELFRTKLKEFDKLIKDYEMKLDKYKNSSWFSNILKLNDIYIDGKKISIKEKEQIISNFLHQFIKV